MSNFLRILFCITGFGLVTLSSAQSYIQDWTIQLGGEGWDILHSADIDSSGAIYFGAQFHGNIQLGDLHFESKKKRALIISKINPAGAISISKQISGSPYNTLDGIFTIKDLILLAGTYKDSLFFSPMQIKDPNVSGLYIVKMDSELEPNRIEIPVKSERIKINSLVQDKSGNLYICGNFKKWISVNDSIVQAIHRRDQFVLRTNSDGKIDWIQTWSINDYKSNVFLQANNNGELIIAGTFEKSLHVEDTIIYSRGNKDVYVVKFDSTGKRVWVRSLGGESNEKAGPIATDRAGNIILSLSFTDSFYFRDTVYTSRNKEGLLLFKMDPRGDLIHSKHVRGIQSDMINKLLTDSLDNLYLLGSVKGKMLFEQDTFSSTDRQRDIILLKIDPEDNYDWMKILRGVSEDLGHTIFSNSINNVFIGGSFSGNLKIDETEIISRGIKDVFFVKYIDPCSLYTYDIKDSAFLCANETDSLDAGDGFLTYNWENGRGDTRYFEIFTPGYYGVSVTDIYGCQKSDTIHVILDTIKVDFQVVDESLPEGNNGSIFTSIEGIANQYVYLWNTGDTTPNLTELSQGDYSLLLSDNLGCSTFVEISVGLDVSSGILSLSNFPNPFRDVTNILYTIPEDMWIEISLYDMNGKKLLTILNRDEEAGSHLYEWNRQKLPSGVYYLQIKVPNRVLSQKIIITDH